MRERCRDVLRPGLILCLLLVHGAAGAGQPRPWTEAVARLVTAYPDFLDRVEGNELVWKDGERTVIDDGDGPKPLEQMLDRPDVKDQLRIAYPPGRTGLPPGRDGDPGRVRHKRLFDKMYGDCLKDEVKDRLVEVVWLPRNAGQRLRITRINGVADRLAAVSRELDELDPKLLRFLRPSSGTYNCRPIAGTGRTSAHGWGFAIDINAQSAEYWQWGRRAADGTLPYRNSVPWEVVEVFERHGFIWGGKWYHYDTMHFEYRPELLPPTR